MRLLYNPYAAMPNLHVGWALLSDYAMPRTGRAWWLRLAGAARRLAAIIIAGQSV